MTSLPIYQIDAFSDQIFSGNPAAICPLDEWLTDDVMQKVASENNLSETAFFKQTGDAAFDLRWFTPTAEVDLCGHATLATAYLLFEKLQTGLDEIAFSTKSGILSVERKGDMIEMCFPARPGQETEVPEGFQAAHGCQPSRFLKASKSLAIFETEGHVAHFVPDQTYIKELGGDGLIISAPGETCDFVSRYFAPHQGVDEDPVTGSAHCTSIPYWSDRLGKSKLHARQISARSGDLYCEMIGDQVKMAGRAAFYMEGTIYLP